MKQAENSTRGSGHQKDEKKKKKYNRYTSGQSGCFNKSAVTDHIAKANHVIDWEGAKDVGRDNNQRFRQNKEAIRISQSPRVMNRDQGTNNLSNIYRSLFTAGGQSKDTPCCFGVMFG